MLESVSDGKNIKYHKAMGLVMEAIDSKSMTRLRGGQIAIGHIWYSTDGDVSVHNTLPLVMKYRKGTIAIAHNGNIVNADALRTTL